MENSRVAKFKQYRDSFTKENSTNFDTKKSNEYIKATNTLPYEEVMQEVDSQNTQQDIANKENFKKGCIIAALVILGIGVVVGLVFLGILAFRG